MTLPTALAQRADHKEHRWYEQTTSRLSITDAEACFDSSRGRKNSDDSTSGGAMSELPKMR